VRIRPLQATEETDEGALLSRRAMVEEQLVARGIRDERALAAMSMADARP
jgi:hypothetical protein